jgi:hypothetical protein
VRRGRRRRDKRRGGSNASIIPTRSRRL